jgi:hypothetical protein
MATITRVYYDNNVSPAYKDEMECGIVMLHQEMIAIYRQQGDTAGASRMQAELEAFLLTL